MQKVNGTDEKCDEVIVSAEAQILKNDESLEHGERSQERERKGIAALEDENRNRHDRHGRVEEKKSIEMARDPGLGLMTALKVRPAKGLRAIAENRVNRMNGQPKDDRKNVLQTQERAEKRATP